MRFAAQYSSDLWKWRSNLPQFLEAEELDTSMLLPLYQRQRNSLNLSFWHALVLVYRPFLLTNFASLTRVNNTSCPESTYAAETERNVAECLKAAMNIVRVVDQLAQAGQMFRAFWVCASIYLFQARLMCAVHSIFLLLCRGGPVCLLYSAAILLTRDIPDLFRRGCQVPESNT